MIFCQPCGEKLIEHHGGDLFTSGCPHCQKVCCCAKRDRNCQNEIHCLKNCPSMFLKPDEIIQLGQSLGEEIKPTSRRRISAAKRTKGGKGKKKTTGTGDAAEKGAGGDAGGSAGGSAGGGANEAGVGDSKTTGAPTLGKSKGGAGGGGGAKVPASKRHRRGKEDEDAAAHSKGEQAFI